MKQWLSMTVDSAKLFTGAKWDASLGICSSVVSSINYQFLVVPSGDKANPQSQIVAAAATFGTKDWMLRQVGLILLY